MSAIRSAALLSVLVASTAIAYAEEFPTAPPRLKDAEAQGLVRMNIAELKAFLPGKMESKGTRGGYVKTFKPDGTVDRADLILGQATGTWRFDEKNNAFCNAFKEKKGYQEHCFAVFRAPDGAHYFSYEVDTGFYAHTWRPVKEE